MTKCTVPVAKINELRQRAGKAAKVPRDVPEGWSKAEIDPRAVVKAFKALRLKPGYLLRAYQFHQGGNGNGVVWAMPVDADFPDPDKCPWLTGRFLSPPRPPSALDNFMDAIDGDGTPLSYVSASILMRELHEFGAIWHGSSWGTHYIFGADPWAGVKPVITDPANAWKWNEPKPGSWRPHVLSGDGLNTVVFFTYTGLEQARITRHTDTFKPGSYAPTTQTATLATGPGGYIH